MRAPFLLQRNTSGRTWGQLHERSDIGAQADCAPRRFMRMIPILCRHASCARTNWWGAEVVRLFLLLHRG
eukprot:gene12315-biopygen7881